MCPEHQKKPQTNKKLKNEGVITATRSPDKEVGFVTVTGDTKMTVSRGMVVSAVRSQASVAPARPPGCRHLPPPQPSLSRLSVCPRLPGHSSQVGPRRPKPCPQVTSKSQQLNSWGQERDPGHQKTCLNTVHVGQTELNAGAAGRWEMALIWICRKTGEGEWLTSPVTRSG